MIYLLSIDLIDLPIILFYRMQGLINFLHNNI
jgi:hypothetical protein